MKSDCLPRCPHLFGHNQLAFADVNKWLALNITDCIRQEYPGLFDEFKVQKILDRWDKFPGIMWGLGFELDYYHSFEVYRRQSVQRWIKAQVNARNALFIMKNGIASPLRQSRFPSIIV